LDEKGMLGLLDGSDAPVAERMRRNLEFPHM